MKVIDLLNKIANGEEVPKCIRYNNENYYFKDSEYRDFVNEEVIYSTLNDEIEIIEEPKKIKKLDLIIDEHFTNDELQAYIYETQVKINEIIDYINKENK